MADLPQLPGQAEVFRHEDGWLGVRWRVPNTDRELYASYAITNPAAFGNPQPTRTVGSREYHVTTAGGMLHHHGTDRIRNTAKHPFRTFVEDFEREAQIAPWLKDPQVLSVVARAVLEGRDVTDAELKTTRWWQTRTDRERQWISQVASDPKTARRMLRENRRQVRDQLEDLGVSGVPTRVVDLLADKATRGEWDPGKVSDQMRRLADPFAPGKLDREVQKALGDTRLDTTREREEDVRGLFREWLGPLYGDVPDKQVAKWAGTLRNDPNGQVQLMDHLRAQRLRILPAWEDPNLSYEDTVAPARTLMQQLWGITPDETDPFFLDVANTRDHHEASVKLRHEGIDRGVDKVVNEVLSKMAVAFGSPVGVRRGP